MTKDNDKTGRAGDGGGVVRVVLFDADSQASSKLRESVESIAGVRLLETTADPNAIDVLLGKTSADVLIANLDPEADAIIAAVRSATKSHDSVEFFATSKSEDASLIKAAMRGGFSEFVHLPNELDRLSEAIGTLRKRSEGEGSLGRIITILGSSGGVGCTTIAVNLAVELAEKSGREVALVDLNFLYGHVAMMLDLEIQHSIADLCGEGKNIDEKLLQKAITKHSTSVHVVPRPREFDEAVGLSAEACVPMLTLLRQMYAYVILDGPSRSDVTAGAVLDLADRNILIVQPLVTAARNAKRILSALERAGFEGQGVEVVCNRAGGGMSHLNAQRLEKSLGTKIVAAIPDDWTSVSASINLGEPLAANAPRSKARDAIRELADLIRGPSTEPAGKESGLFSRLFK